MDFAIGRPRAARTITVVRLSNLQAAMAIRERLPVTQPWGAFAAWCVAAESLRQQRQASSTLCFV